MKHFKLGDVVVCTEARFGNGFLKVGWEYTVFLFNEKRQKVLIKETGTWYDAEYFKLENKYEQR